MPAANKLPFLAAEHDAESSTSLLDLSIAETSPREATPPHGSNILCGQIST
jgi:hypothetical protein